MQATTKLIEKLYSLKSMRKIIYFMGFVLLYLFITGFVLLNASLCYRFGVKIVFILLKTV